MPQTRKKTRKTIYKDEDDSEEARDFSDSGSEAHITEPSSDDDEEMEASAASGDEFVDKPKRKSKKTPIPKTKFAKSFINKISKQSKNTDDTSDNEKSSHTIFTVKDLTEADKLLPSVLNLSESDTSDDDDSSNIPEKLRKKITALNEPIYNDKPCKDVKLEYNDSSDDDDSSNIPEKLRKKTAAMNKPIYNDEPCKDVKLEYNDVWSNKIQENSEIIAKNTFLDLEQHKVKIEETIISIQSYKASKSGDKDYDVNDLLAQGEDIKDTAKTSKKVIKKRNDSDSEIEDWEEVKEETTIPKQGIQLIVDFPDGACKKKKKIDVEMMMRRKINRTKKEYQVYMHKVHVLCWLAHGNYVSQVLNDHEVLTAVVSLIPSKDCYPGDRVDMQYVEHITKWFKEKITIKQDKNENKYKPKAPPLKNILLEQIKNKNATTKKYKVFLFVSMLRAIGLQCRIMFNFVTLPIKPPAFELCSLSTKANEDKSNSNVEKKIPSNVSKQKKSVVKKTKSKNIIPQVDGSYDCLLSDDSDFSNIMQVDGNDDSLTTTRITRSTRSSKPNIGKSENDDVLPSKRARKSPAKKTSDTQNSISVQSTVKKHSSETKSNKVKRNPTINSNKQIPNIEQSNEKETKTGKIVANVDTTRTRNTRSTRRNPVDNLEVSKVKASLKEPINKDNSYTVKPQIIVSSEEKTSSSYFDNENTSKPLKNLSLSRKRTHTVDPTQQNDSVGNKGKVFKTKSRTRSAPVNQIEESNYFCNNSKSEIKKKTIQIEASEDSQRVSHRDLARKAKPKPNNDVTADLIGIIKNRVKEAKAESRNKVVKGKVKEEQDDDSDYLPEKITGRRNTDSDEDFKPKKLSPRPPQPSTSRKKDLRGLSDGDDNIVKNKTDVWCEIFVEELEQWIAVDVIKGQVHCVKAIYDGATHPVCYIVGWDNNNYLKDLTRRYVPHWNTVTRKQRAEPQWWRDAIQPWLGPKTARDREEDETLDRMQLEAPLPKSIAEYKNHPLYALRRHLLKFEAIFPPEAATLGFVRNEPVYARECVYTCRSRDTWLKEAKVVRLGEKPYKVVKARPKWDRLSNKLITDKPLEVFGPWQVQDYEPPVAENGVVPRNAYGNVELFKECMLPKGTVHIKLPGLNKVARKLNIDCAPAMTGFDFNGGWSHPVYDGFVVCKEFKEEIMEAWLKDQEDQERREREKVEARVYGNWKRLIKGLLIGVRLRDKYGFNGVVATRDKMKSKGPRLVVKKS